jgi:hypothetical protein
VITLKETKMNKFIYWATVGILSFMMLFGAYNYLFNPQVPGFFTHLGFPDYLRIELAIAKIAGVAVLLTPKIPVRIKEWAYAGFGIVLLSASIAHYNSGDSATMIVMPLIFLCLLIVSNFYLYRLYKK